VSELSLAGEESVLEHGSPRLQFEAQSLFASDAGGGDGKLLGVGCGFKVQARFKALLKVSFQPSVVGFGNGGTYKFGVVQGGAGTLSRGELCGVDLVAWILAVTVERSRHRNPFCTPTSGVLRRAFARRFVDRLPSVRSTTHAGVAEPG
jgi:hypothetical protein